MQIYLVSIALNCLRYIIVEIILVRLVTRTTHTANCSSFLCPRKSYWWLSHRHQFSDWLISRTSVHSLTDSLTDSLIDWLTDWLIDWLTDWLTNWLTDWRTDRLVDWQTDWRHWLMHAGGNLVIQIATFRSFESSTGNVEVEIGLAAVTTLLVGVNGGFVAVTADLIKMSVLY